MRNNLALLLEKTGRAEEAVSMYQEIYETRIRLLGEGAADTLAPLQNLGFSLNTLGRYSEAAEKFRQALDSYPGVFPADNWIVANAHRGLGEALLGMGDYFAAERELLEALRVFHDQLGESHDRSKRTRDALVRLYTAWNKPNSAAKYR